MLKENDKSNSNIKSVCALKLCNLNGENMIDLRYRSQSCQRIEMHEIIYTLAFVPKLK